MIKVALISHSIAFTGAEKMLYCLGMLFHEDANYYPIIFCPQDSAYGVLPQMCDGKIEVIRYPTYPWYLYVSRENRAKFASDTLQAAEDLSRLLREQEMDLVICNTMTSLAPMMAARDAGIPAILWVHGIIDSYYVSSNFNPARRLLNDRILMALSSQVVCCSKWTEDYYRGLTATPVCTVVNWTDPPKRQSAVSLGNPFVCLNTFDPHKGIMVLLKAAERLKKKKIDFHIDLYGTGSEEEALRQFVSSHHLEKEISFCGRTKDVDSVYRNCYALIQPCDLEPFGLTITEAMSHSRPVIAMNSGGPSEIVKDGKTGFLVQPRDDEALAEKMEYLLAHEEEAEYMGDVGQKRYQELYSPQRAKKEFTKLFNKVLSEPKQKSFEIQLLEDTLREWLLEDASELLLPNGRSEASGLPEYQAEQICFSGPIARKRVYRVSCNAGDAKGLGLLLTSLSAEPARGMLNVRLIQHGQVVSEGHRSMDQVAYNLWSILPLTVCRTCESGTVDIELCFDYEPGSGILGVYEWRRGRSFWYKVFNKLNHPLKGMNTLIAPILQ